MIRRRHEWKIRDGVLTLGERTLVMGILNVSPDSFSDGGLYSDPANALQHALELQQQGADIIDVGAESTKPGSQRVSEHDEIARLIPVLKKLKGRLDIPVSVDTYKPAVAELAMQHGASIINDVSGLTWEPELTKVVRDSGAGLILNHMRGTPETWAKLAPLRDVMGEIAAELEASVHRARAGGVELDHIIVDPGIGFGKRKEQNSEILARLGELRRLMLPILVGPSRKLFLAHKEPEALEFATAAAVSAAILNGAYLVRVHNVAAMCPVIDVVDAVIQSAPEPREEEKKETRPPKKRDFDLRPDREIASPPRPLIKPAAKPVEERPQPPKRDYEPREERPAGKPIRPSGPPKYDEERPRREFKPRDDRRPPQRDFKPGYGRDKTGPPAPRGGQRSGPGGPSRGPGGPSRGPGGPSRGPGGPSRGPGGPSRGPGGPSRGPGGPSRGSGGFSRGPGGPSRGPGGPSRGPSGPSRGSGGFSRGPGGPSRGPGGPSRGPGGPSRGPGGPSRGPGGPSRGPSRGPDKGPRKGPGGRGPSTPRSRG